MNQFLGITAHGYYIPLFSIFQQKSMEIQIHRLLGVLLCINLLTQAPGLETYIFPKGTNASVAFIHILSGPNSSYSSELFTLDSQFPFYGNGMLHTNILRPAQQSRFCVFLDDHRERNLTVILIIENIEKIDENVYILTIRENNDGIFQNFIYDAYLSVHLPPGIAQCSLDFCSDTLKVCEISCEATLGSDGGGQLHCYQNSQTAVIRKPLERSSNQITAIFWVSTLSTVQCCSSESNSHTDLASCMDYTHVFFDDAHSTSPQPDSFSEEEPITEPIKLGHEGQMVTAILETSSHQECSGSKSNYVIKPYLSALIIMTNIGSSLYM